MKDMKFLIKDEDQSRRLQTVLYEMGFSWCRYPEGSFLHKEAIFTRFGNQLWHGGADYYHSNITYYVAMDTEAFIAAHTTNPEPEVKASGKIKSDGGSTDYYKLTIKTKNGSFECEMGDVIEAVVNSNFELGNALKAVRRIWCESEGMGKEGIDMNYDAKKINYFVADFIERQGR